MSGVGHGQDGLFRASHEDAAPRASTPRRLGAALATVVGHLLVVALTLGLWWGILLLGRLVLGVSLVPWLAKLPP